MSSIEEWKDIPGFNGYQCSNTGNIRSFWKKSGGRYPKKLDKPYEMVVRVSSHGYKKVKINQKHMSIHRLVLITFNRMPKDGEICRHLDGNKLNNNLSNLKWGSLKENSDDCLKHGNRPLGESHYASRLNKETVNLIRKSNKTDKELSIEYGVTKDHIYKIKTFSKWREGNVIHKRGRNTKISDDQVKEIRKSNKTTVELAKDYKISQQHVSHIKLNKTRKHI